MMPTKKTPTLDELRKLALRKGVKFYWSSVTHTANVRAGLVLTVWHLMGKRHVFPIVFAALSALPDKVKR